MPVDETKRSRCISRQFMTKGELARKCLIRVRLTYPTTNLRPAGLPPLRPPEPRLAFAHRQQTEYPRDRLFLSLPADASKTFTETHFGRTKKQAGLPNGFPVAQAARQTAQRTHELLRDDSKYKANPASADVRTDLLRALSAFLPQSQ